MLLQCTGEMGKGLLFKGRVKFFLIFSAMVLPEARVSGNDLWRLQHRKNLSRFLALARVTVTNDIFSKASSTSSFLNLLLQNKKCHLLRSPCRWGSDSNWFLPRDPNGLPIKPRIWTSSSCALNFWQNFDQTSWGYLGHLKPFINVCPLVVTHTISARWTL